MNIEDMKQYLRIDDDSDDLLLDGLVFAAKNYMSNAGVQEKSENDLYDLSIKLLVSHWYENREVTGTANKLAFSLESIIVQLKYCEV